MAKPVKRLNINEIIEIMNNESKKGSCEIITV